MPESRRVYRVICVSSSSTRMLPISLFISSISYFSYGTYLKYKPKTNLVELSNPTAMPPNCGTCWAERLQYRWLSDFIFYPRPLYKSLHQSFFCSFIIILPSESGVTLDYSTISPYTLWFRHFTSILDHLSRDFEKTTITAMYHGRWFAYKQTNKYFYCQS